MGVGLIDDQQLKILGILLDDLLELVLIGKDIRIIRAYLFDRSLLCLISERNNIGILTDLWIDPLDILGTYNGKDEIMATAKGNGISNISSNRSA